MPFTVLHKKDLFFSFFNLRLELEQISILFSLKVNFLSDCNQTLSDSKVKG